MIQNMDSFENFETDFPEAAKPLVEASEKIVEETLNKVETRVNDPASEAAEAVVQLSTGAQLKDAVKRHFIESGKIAWSSAKAVGVGTLSLIPVLGGAGEAATAELVDAAVLEGGVTKAEAQALAKGAVVTESGKVVPPLTKAFGKKGAERIVKVLNTLEPFEDVPAAVVVVSGAAEALGLEGAGVIPAGIQLVVNKAKTVKQQFRFGKEIGGILTKSPEAQKIKDFASLAVRNIKGRLEQAATPKMALAAQAFQPALA